MSHLACAELPDHPLNRKQHETFMSQCRRLPGVPASLAASSGIFLGRDYHFDLVRPGAALYGVNPQPGRPNPMRQIVRLRARILQIRDVDAGQPVGYGAAHVMAAAGRLATVAVGYADGWMRSLSQRGSGRIGGVAGSPPGPGFDGSCNFRRLRRRPLDCASWRLYRTAGRRLRRR